MLKELKMEWQNIGRCCKSKQAIFKGKKVVLGIKTIFKNIQQKHITHKKKQHLKFRKGIKGKIIYR